MNGRMFISLMKTTKFFIGLFILLIGTAIGIFWRTRNSEVILITWEKGHYLESRNKQVCNRLISQEKQQNLDVNDDGIKEKLYLAENKFYLEGQEKIIWSSGDNFKVDNFVVGDINNDNEIEIVLILWKQGKYGQGLPFWLEGNINDYGHHVFIYKWQNSNLVLKWGSSTIDAPIKELMISDVNQDGKNELVVLEGNYKKYRQSFAEYLSIWHWQGWNFFNDFRSTQGKYSGLGAQNIEGKKYICAKIK